MFGLLLEADEVGPNEVRGRAFIKQDHQGARPGFAHEGIIASALSEAIAFAVGPGAGVRHFQIEILGDAPVGAFLDVEARAFDGHAAASVRADGRLIASARGYAESGG